MLGPLTYWRTVFTLLVLARWGHALGDQSSSSRSHCASLKDAQLKELFECVDNTWIHHLEPDPAQGKNAPNKEARQVRSGHYVLVRPTPLPDPQVVACSKEMFLAMGLSPKVCSLPAFARVFSGDVDVLPGFGPTWATPYALSIYGTEQEPGRGASTNGYGDGRAISVAEVVVRGERWEIQFKGSGTTPFCRGADGRAVLRSSIREYLASEAMHHLGVPTTRALSIVASKTEAVTRPWYSKGQHEDKHGGDMMQYEFCAITTRVSPSFIRVGHFELYGRRARTGSKEGRKQLELLARHALFRHFPQILEQQQSFQEQLLTMTANVAGLLANLSAEWVRVGYTQSNFNADNCLISGRTVDYGPFGFMERYDPSWGMWIHAGEHFAFMNQPVAAGKNFRMFAQSLRELMDEDGTVKLRQIMGRFEELASEALARMWARKLGLHAKDVAQKLWRRLDKLMQADSVDYTILWRQLADVLGQGDEVDDEELLIPLEAAFYEPLRAQEPRRKWIEWIRDWLSALLSEKRPVAEVIEGMKQASPKFVPREWMLVQAYSEAEDGNHTMVDVLQELFRRPYAEHPVQSGRFYQKRPLGADKEGGVGFMS